MTELYAYAHPAGLLTRQQLRVAALTPGSAARDLSDMAFDTVMAYDGNGNLSDVGYPSVDLMGLPATVSPERLLVSQYTYDTLTRIRHVGTASSPADIVLLTYHPNATLQNLTHVLSPPAAPVTEIFALDPDGMVRPRRIDVSAGSWSTGQYQYDAAGNVTQIGADEFFYDKVGRLLRGSVNGRVQQAAFDAYGNVTSLVTDGVSVPIAVDATTNRLAGPGEEYDAFGNVTRWQGRQLAYDSQDMVSRIADSGGGALSRSFVYSADNARVGVIDYVSGDETWSVRGPSDRTLREFRRVSASGSLDWRKDYLYGGARLIASFEKSAAGALERHYHLDHLGSTRLVTDGAGTAVARYDYFPFGGLASAAGPHAGRENMLFTGHERDANGAGSQDDLDYMMARYYAPGQGRFLGIDRGAVDPLSPQAMNRYAYTQGNPLAHVDPDGNLLKIATAAIRVGTALYKGYDLYSTVEGVVTSTRTILSSDPHVGTGERLKATAGLIAEVSGATDIYKGAKAAAKAVGIVTKGKKAGNALGQATDFTRELNRKKPSGELRKSLGMKVGDGQQAHHIFPTKYNDHAIMQRAARGGFNANGAENGIALPKDWHRGYHENYSVSMSMTLDDIARRNPNITDSEAAEELRKLAGLFKERLEPLLQSYRQTTGTGGL